MGTEYKCENCGHEWTQNESDLVTCPRCSGIVYQASGSAKDLGGVTEAAADLADERGVDLHGVVGSGVNGQILKSDVEQLISEDTEEAE